MTPANRKQRTRPISALVCVSALTVVHSGLNLLLLPLYVNYIPPNEYGVLAAVTIVAVVIGVASNLKLDAAMRTFYFDYCDDPEALESYLRQILSTSVYFASIVYVAMLLAGESVFRLVFAHDELRFFPAGAIALATASVSGCLSSYLVYLRNSLRLWELVRWQLSIVIGTVGMQLFFVVVLQLGLYGVLWGSLLPTVLTMLLVCASHPGLIGARPDWRFLMPSLKYSLPLIALGLCYALGTRLDRLVLEHYVEIDSLGAYAILAGLFGLLTIVLNALDNAVRPYLYPAMRSNGNRADSSVESYQQLYALAGLLALSLAVFVGANLHLLTADPVYLSTQKWLLLGATAFAPTIFTRYYALFFDFHKRSVAMTVAVTVRVAVMYVLLVLFVPRFAIGGALLAIFVAEVLNALAFGFTARRLFHVTTSLRTIGAQLAVFLGAIWFLAYTVGSKSSAAFGALQLVAVAGVLLATNRRALRTLLAKPGPQDAAVAPHAG